MNLQQLDTFHKTRAGHLVFGLAEFGLGCELANLAIPSGDWWEWLLAAVFLLGFVQNLGRAVMATRGEKQ